MDLLSSFLTNGDSLIAVNSSTSFIFSLSTSGPKVYNFPRRSSSFYAETEWMSKQFDAHRVKNPNETCFNTFYQNLDKHSQFILNSIAPYGYEFEEDFIVAGRNPYQLETKKCEKYSSAKIRHQKLYETDKVLRHTTSTHRAIYIKRLNLITTTLVKKHTTRIVFFKETKQLVSYSGLKLTPNFYAAILPYDFKLRLDQIIQTEYPQLKGILPLKDAFTAFSLYRKALLNPLWKDLHSKYALRTFTSNHKDYRKLLYTYKHKGTKQSRTLVYGTSNKALIRHFEKEGTSDNVIDCCKFIMQNFNLKPEKMLHILSKSQKEKNSFLTGLNTDMLKNLIKLHEYGFEQLTIERLLDMLEKGNRSVYYYASELRDIVWSLKLLKQSNVKLTYPEFKAPFNLSLFSTQLGKMVAEIQDKQFLIPFAHSEELHEYFDYQDDKFKYVFADNASLLRDCGNQMSICVGSYGDRARSRQCDIILVYKNEDLRTPYCCVEVRKSGTVNRRPSVFDSFSSSPDTSYSLVQAKLQRNSPARTDEELKNSITAWCTLKSVHPDAYDLRNWEDREPSTIQMNMVLEHPQPRGEQANFALFDDLPF